jgi:hypothetical protein
MRLVGQRIPPPVECLRLARLRLIRTDVHALEVRPAELFLRGTSPAKQLKQRPLSASSLPITVITCCVRRTCHNE